MEAISGKAKMTKRGKSTALLIGTKEKWYDIRNTHFNGSSQKVTLNRKQEFEMRKEAEQLLNADVTAYRQTQDVGSKKKDFVWIRTVLKQGTFSDKLAAQTILLQDSAIHNLQSLQHLVEMVNPKGQRECLMAMENLRELFLGDLLEPDVKLKPFSELVCYVESDQQKRRQQLILCYYEDMLRTNYRKFVEAVDKTSYHSLDNLKNKAINAMYDLLVNHCEQEQFLLERLVNKLGDPIPRIASHTSHLLAQLVNDHHPDTKSIVIAEVERLMYRPNVKTKAQYYCLCFLNEMFLRAQDQLVANKLIGVYFKFFQTIIKKGDVNTKIMRALLTGVSRSFPYSKMESNVLQDHVETFYKIINYVNFNIGIQAMILIFNVLDTTENGSLTDRFYSMLYRHLHSDLENSSRKAMFLNLVFKAIKRDCIVARTKSFIKRLFQVSQSVSSSLSCSILFLVSEVLKEKGNIASCVETVRETFDDDDQDEDERYEDVDDEPSEMKDGAKDKEDELCKEEESDAIKNVNPSWVHCVNINKHKNKHFYDPLCRNPLYCYSERENFWELCTLSKHYHPSVTLFSQQILDQKFVAYDGDPLGDFTLKRFLDRFVYRNPKSVAKNESLNSKLKTRFARINSKATSAPLINSTTYIKLPEERIPLEERFIYSFLKEKAHSKTDEDESDADSVTSEEFERLLERYEPGFERADYNFEKQLKKEFKNKSKNEEDDTLDELQDDDDEDIDFGDDEEFNAAFDGEFDDLFDEDDVSSTKFQRRHRKKDVTNLFASADEFAQLLDANEESDIEETNALEDCEDSKPRRNKRQKKTKGGIKRFKSK